MKRGVPQPRWYVLKTKRDNDFSLKTEHVDMKKEWTDRSGSHRSQQSLRTGRG